MSATLVLGADSAALNATAKLAYNQFYPGIFKRTIPIGQDGIKCISYDVQAAPTFVLNASAQRLAEHAKVVRSALEARLEDIKDAAAETNPDAPVDAAAICDLFVDAAQDPTLHFELASSKVTFTVVADDGTSHDWPASFICLCQIDVQPGGILAPSVVNATLTFTGPNPSKTLEWLLNNAVLPALVHEFNTNFLVPVAIPLQFGDLDFRTPTVAVQDDAILVLSSTLDQPAPTAPTPGTSWPSGKAFLLLETSLVNRFVDGRLAEISQAGSASITEAGILFSAAYFLGLEDVEVGFSTKNPLPAQITAAGEGTLKASVDKYTLASATFLARATPSFRASVQVDYPTVNVTFDAIVHQDVTIHIPWLPKPLRPYVDTLVVWLNSPLATLIENLLLLWQNTLSFTAPPIRIPIGGRYWQITFDNVETIGLVDRDGQQRVGFQGQIAGGPLTKTGATDTELSA